MHPWKENSLQVNGLDLLISLVVDLKHILSVFVKNGIHSGRTQKNKSGIIWIYDGGLNSVLKWEHK